MACAPGAVGASKRLVDDVAGRQIDHALMADDRAPHRPARVSDEGSEGVAGLSGSRAAPAGWRDAAA